KGLPMTYNRDLQEDKERLFDAADTVRGTVRILAGMLRHTTVNEIACAKASADPSLLATDLADYLVRKGLPFRKAHHIVGGLVALAERQGKTLDQIGFTELQALSDLFWPDVAEIFDLNKAMAKRNLTGAPGTRQVRRQLGRWRK